MTRKQTDTADTADAASAESVQATEQAKIPVIDVAALFDANATPAEKQQVGEHIVNAAEGIGFLMVTNTSIPASQVKQAFDLLAGFFAQDDAKKAEISIEKSQCHRGYFSVGRENLDPDKQQSGDVKEGIKIGQDLPVDHPWVLQKLPLHGPNQWPDYPEFKPIIGSLYQDLSEVSNVLLEGIALGLGLPQKYFRPAFETPMATLAPLHYPAMQLEQDYEAKKQPIGAGAHTDFGCISLVLQNGVSGLQVQTRQGEWVDVPVVENAFVMNIGDMLQRWSNDRLRSTWHRVINQSNEARYSMAFFYEPEHDTLLDCLPNCQRFKRFAYDRITALDYLMKRITETFDYYGKDKT